MVMYPMFLLGTLPKNDGQKCTSKYPIADKTKTYKMLILLYSISVLRISHIDISFGAVITDSFHKSPSLFKQKNTQPRHTQP